MIVSGIWIADTDVSLFLKEEVIFHPWLLSINHVVTRRSETDMRH